MKYVKRILPLALALCMALSLAACGRKDDTTADGLMAALRNMDPAAHYIARADLDLQAEQEGQAVSMKLGMGLESCGGVSHVSDGQISLGAEGMSFAIGFEAWADQAAKAAYANMSMMGMDAGWSKSDLSGLDGMASDMDAAWPEGTEFILSDREKDQDYTVSWTIPPEALKQAMSGLPGEDAGADPGMLPGMTDITDGMDISSCTGTAVFDHDAKTPKSVTVDLAGAGISSCRLVITFDTFAGEPVALSVPQEVIDAAAQAAADPGLDGWSVSGGDDWDWDDDSAGGVEEELYSNDGDGYDELIDGMGESLRGAMPDGGSASVLHYSDHAELSFRYDPGDAGWYGDVQVRNVSGDGSASEYFANDKAFYDDWYDAGPADQGDDYAIYYRSGEMNYVCIVGDMTVDASVYSSGSDYDAMMGHLTELLSMAGVG